MSICRVVLASAPRDGIELLNLIGIEHEVVPPTSTKRCVRAKRRDVTLSGLRARRRARSPFAIRISSPSAPTPIVVINRKVLGKPADTDDAARMLGMLSGREHTVITAVAVARGRKLRSAIEEVKVKFRRLREDEIEAYIATGEPMDKAGAYGIQGFGATIVERIEGDYFAVMGLPLVRLVGLMRDVGVRYRFGELATSAD